MDYIYKTEPFDHQRKDFELHRDQTSWGLFHEMGTGKTKIAIDTIAYLFLNNKIDVSLVIAPKGIYRIWGDQMEQHCPDVSGKTFIWDSSMPKSKLSHFKGIICAQYDGFVTLVMNVEAFSQKKGFEFASAFIKNRRAIITVDESTTIKNYKAQRSKHILALSRSAKYKRILTGTPITKSPLDLFSQCLFLGNEHLGHTSFFSFRNRYAVMEAKKFGQRSFNQVVGFQRMDELTEKLSKFSSRLTKDECLDLPDKIYQTREVLLSDQQKECYLDMVKKLRVEFENQELTVTTALAQIVRLHQITCGHLATDNGNIIALEENRTKELINVIDELELDAKVIVWANYVADIRRIACELKNKYGPDSTVTYYGETKEAERVEALEKFQGGDGPRFFVGNPQTGGFGLTLTASCTVIYFSNSYNLEHRLQSEDRAHRIGQTKNVTYIDLVSRLTVDEKIIKALKDKKNIADSVVGDELKEWISNPTKLP